MYIAICEKRSIGIKEGPFQNWMIVGGSKEDLTKKALKRAKEHFSCYKMGNFVKGKYLPYPDCPDTTETYSTILATKTKDKSDNITSDGYPVFVAVITIMWIEKV